MCFVVDANVMGLFCDKSNSTYSPIWQFLYAPDSKCKMIVGGQKYFDEMEACTKFRSIFIELRKTRKAVRINSELVDARQAEIEAKLPGRCDDPHLIALLDVSECRILISDDRRADRFICDSKIFKDRKTRHIYRSSDHISIFRNHINNNIKHIES